MSLGGSPILDDDVIAWFLRSFPTNNHLVEVQEVVTNTRYRGLEWETILNRQYLPSLTCVDCSSLAASDLLWTMVREFAATSTSQITSLQIRDMNGSKNYCSYFHSTWLWMTLRTRTQIGAPVQKLRLTGCERLDYDELDLLVHELVIDGFVWVRRSTEQGIVEEPVDDDNAGGRVADNDDEK